jgi:iron complex outermembrane recepter protein
MESINAELTAQLNETWTTRANFSWSKYKIWFKGTGLGQVNITVPASYFPAGTAYPTTANAAYLAAAELYAADLLEDPNLALQAPYAQMQRRLNLQETFGIGKASQVELTGRFKAGTVELKPLFGVSYLEYEDNTRSRLAPTSAFPAPWNMYDPSTWKRDTDYVPETLPLSQFDRGIRRGKAAYGILNSTFFGGKLYTVTGGRYARTSGANDNFLTPSASLSKTSHSNFAPQVGAGWKVTREVLLYGSYSESFQNSIANLQVANVPSGPAVPTTSKGYEVGVKTDLFGGRVSSTVSVFSIEQRDRVINFNTTSPAGVVLVNRMQGTLDRSRGVEAEVTLSPTDTFQIYLSGSLNDVEVESTPPGTEYLLGSQPENTVRELANIQARYTFKGTLKGLWASLGANYSGKKA